MAEELPDWAKPEADEQLPDWAKPEQSPVSSWVPKDVTRAGEAMGETFTGGARAAKQLVTPTTDEEREARKSETVGQSAKRALTTLGETAAGVLSPLTMTLGVPWAGAESIAASRLAAGARGAGYLAAKVAGLINPETGKQIEEAIPSSDEAYEQARLPVTIGSLALAAGPLLSRAGRAMRSVPAKGEAAAAGRVIESFSDDPAKLRATLETPPPPHVPKSEPTTYQMTGDQGLGELERASARRESGAFNQRVAEQNAARLEALEGVQATGSPEAAAQHLRDILRQESAQADDMVRIAQQRAWEQAQALGGTLDAATYGNILRRELRIAEDTVRATEGALWRQVDPNNMLRSNPQPIQVLERSIYGPETMTQAGAASVTPAERQITELIQNYRNIIPFQELRDLRSLTSTALRDELYTHGRTPAYGRLSQLRQGIEDAIPRTFTETGQVDTAAQVRLRAASAATRQRAERFAPVKDIIRREGAEGPYRMGESAVMGRIIQPGPKGYDSASNFLRAAGNRNLDVLQDAVAADMRRSVVNAEGYVDNRKLQVWLKQRDGVLRAISERDGGAFVQRLRDAGQAQEAIGTAVARQQAVITGSARGNFRNLIGAVDDADVAKTLGNVFGKQNSVALARELRSQLTTPESLEGARRAIVEHMRTRLLSNAEAAASGKPLIRAEQFQNFIKHNEAALRQIFEPAQVDAMKAIARDIQQMNRSTGSKARIGGSDTYQAALAEEAKRSGIVKEASRTGSILRNLLVDYTLGKIPLIGRPISHLGQVAMTERKARRAGESFDRITEMIDRAMLEPEYARQLLGKTHTTPHYRRTPSIATGLAPYGVAAQEQTSREPRKNVPSSGGPRGRPQGARPSPVPRSARGGTVQALADGGEARHEEADQGIEEGQFDPTARGAVGGQRAAPQLFPRNQFSEPSRNQTPEARGRPRILRGEVLLPPGGWKIDPGFPIKQWPIPGGHHLADGGEARQPQAAPLGARERMAMMFSGSPAGGAVGASLSGSVAGGSASSEKRKKNVDTFSREDVVQYLKRRGVGTDQLNVWRSFPISAAEEKAEGMAKGGLVEDDSLREDTPLPLPGLSRGLSSTAGPTVSSTTPEEDIPPPVTHGGETFPTYALRNMAAGLVDLFKTPGRVYREGMTDEDVDWGPAMATQMMGAGVGAAKPGSVGVFGGRLSKTANLDMLTKAEEMAAKGAPKESIWNQTGWFQGADGKWRYEIPDQSSYLKPTEKFYPLARNPESFGDTGHSMPSPLQKGRLEDLIHHPEFFEAYPHMRDMEVTLEHNPVPGGAYIPPRSWPRFDPGDIGSLELRARTYGDPLDPRSAWSMLLHEMQHGVQSREGFAPGASPHNLPFTQRKINSMARERTLKEGLPWDLMNAEQRAQVHRAVRQEEYEKYAGETESRNVQERRNYTQEGRQRPPWETQDVPTAMQHIPVDESVALGIPPKGRTKPFRPPFMAAEYLDEPPVAGLVPTSRVTPARKGAELVPRLASPEEITRAAEASQGMTQPQLRSLYQELGLTGLPPTELASRSLVRTQPPGVIQEATALKMADREKLNELTPAERKLFQQGKLNKPGFMLPSQEAAEAGKRAYAPVKKEITRAEKEFDAMPRRPAFFDVRARTLNRQPDVEQFPLPRVAPKMTERLEPAFAGGSGLRRIERAAEQSQPSGWGWYNIQEALKSFVDILGPVRGPQAAAAWLDSLAGTSMVNPISSNVRGSSYYLGQVMRGEPLPQVLHLTDPYTGKTVKTLAGPPPPGYGAKSQVQHADRVREYLENAGDPVTNPKPMSYRQNLGGNYGPRTIDTHDIRNMIGMPQALKTFGEEGALLPGEYSMLERLGARAAQRARTPQAPQQAATWVGGGEYTGLKSEPIPLAEVLNRRIWVTSKVTGKTPEQVWTDHVTGRAPLMSRGGLVA